MKKIFVSMIALALAGHVLHAQDLSQKVLLKKHKRTWQWDIGKTVFVVGDEVLSGMSVDVIGRVGKSGGKWAVAVDNVRSGTSFKQLLNSTSAYRVMDYGLFNVRYEYMFRPDRLFYFTASLKAGLGGMTREFITPTIGGAQTSTSSETFSVLAPGASLVCNILPGAGIGLNANYRFTKMNKTSALGTTGDTHYAFGVFLRLTINKNTADVKGANSDSYRGK